MLKKMLQCKQVIPLIATLFSPVLMTSAEAVTVIQDGMGNAIAIEDIQIVETGVQLPGEDVLTTVTSTYRVDFLLGSFNAIFGDPTLPDFDTSCDLGESNKLCFWQNDPQAELVIDQINGALNALNPVPSFVAGIPFDFPSPPLPNTNNFYYVPKDFDGVNVITSRQGRNNDDNVWVTETADFPTGTGVVTSYAGATLTAQEFKAEIPESSNVIGIIVIGLSMILVTKKK
ncbi:MAG: hypothetical protein QNJ42_17105 [Crocosphaera sp.]|nr:hypothetical protein [Crocosphaera sp.]